MDGGGRGLINREGRAVFIGNKLVAGKLMIYSISTRF
jgi:hypothetical protein